MPPAAAYWMIMSALTCCPKKTCRNVLNVPSNQFNRAGNIDVKSFSLSLFLSTVFHDNIRASTVLAL